MLKSIMFVSESKPIRSLKDKYRIDRMLSIQKDVLKEPGLCSVGLGEISIKNASTTDKTQM